MTLNKTIERIEKEFDKEHRILKNCIHCMGDCYDVPCICKEIEQEELELKEVEAFISKALREVAEEAVREVGLEKTDLPYFLETYSVTDEARDKGYNEAVEDQQQKAKDYLERK